MLASRPLGDVEADLMLNTVEGSLRAELVTALDRYRRVLATVQDRPGVDLAPLRELIAHVRDQIAVVDQNIADRSAWVASARATALSPALSGPVSGPVLVPAEERRTRLRQKGRPVTSFWPRRRD